MGNFTTENLIPYTGTIQPGQRLIKRKDGTFLPIGVAGAGTGTSMDFYKCTYVNSDSWGGRKAVLNNGIYSFQSDSTQGLVYSNKKPAAGGIYSQNALIKVAQLYDGISDLGLVFYAPMADSSNVVKTEQTVSGSLNYTTIDGIPCGMFSGEYLYGQDSILSGGGPFSISVWLKSNTASQVHWAMAIGSAAENQAVLCGIRWDNRYNFAFYANDDDDTSISVNTSLWIHLVFVFDGTVGTTYANGQDEPRRVHTFGQVNIGSGWQIGALSGGQTWSGYMAGLRVYNRILSLPQIKALYKEFTPTI